MNTTEHLVEIYYRQKGFFTSSDIKVEHGNNRQFDLLAFNYKTQGICHVEINVAHNEHWADSLEKIKDKMEFKFFGKPRNNRPDNLNTDFNKGKTYFNSIKETYSKFGFDFQNIIRVWCIWCLPEEANKDKIDDLKNSIASEYDLNANNFQILLFRDDVLPFLLEKIGTSHYDDELLRTLSLIKEYNKQLKS